MSSISLSSVIFWFFHIFSYVVSSWSCFRYSDDISLLMFPYLVLCDCILWHFILKSRARDPGVFGPDVSSHFTVGTLEALFGPKFRILACFLMIFRHNFLVQCHISIFCPHFRAVIKFLPSFSFFSSIFRHFHFRLLLLHLILLIAIFCYCWWCFFRICYFLLHTALFVVLWCRFSFPHVHYCFCNT